MFAGNEINLNQLHGFRGVGTSDILHTIKVQIIHDSDITMDAMASQITNLTIVYLTVCSGADQRKH